VARIKASQPTNALEVGKRISDLPRENQNLLHARRRSTLHGQLMFLKLSPKGEVLDTIRKNAAAFLLIEQQIQ